MKKLLISIVLFLGLVAAPAQEQPGNHLDLTSAILDFLSRTELCLNSCRDAASTKGAIPQLQELKKECEKLAKIQRELPEPTVQDYMAVQHHMEAFNTVWNAIRAHIERMEQDKLLSEEVRNILRIAPNPQAH